MSARDDYPVLAAWLPDIVAEDRYSEVTNALDEIDRLHAENLRMGVIIGLCPRCTRDLEFVTPEAP